MRFYLPLLILFLVGCNADRLATLEKKNQDLQTQLKEQKTAANLDLQEKCSKAARAEFLADGWGKEAMANFTNHYNTKVNKCFMEISNTDAHTSPGDIFTSRTVIDAFEGKGYAEYMWKTDKVKKYWEVAPFLCKVTLLSGEEKFCKSTEEFDELIKPFMEQ